MNQIILIGAGGHAKTVVDTIEQQGVYQIAGFIDNNNFGKEIYHSYRVIGCDKDLESFFQSGINFAFVTIGFMGKSDIRNRLYDELKRIGFIIPTIIDSTAIVASDVQFGEGCYVGRKAVIDVEAQIGKMCIVNTASVIEHECVIEEFTHIAVGGIVCGQVEIGKNVLLGAGAIVIQQKHVADFSIIGAGSVVINNIPENDTVMGVPARKIKKMEI